MSHQPFAALNVPGFIRFVFARFFLTVGVQMQSVIVGWQIYEFTKDEFSLGIIGICEAVPFLSVALFAGHLADKYNRKKIVSIAKTALLICSLFLLYFSFNNELFLKNYGLSPLFGIIFCSGLARGFIGPAYPAMLATLVPRNNYANASTWNSTAWQIAAVAGQKRAGSDCC